MKLPIKAPVHPATKRLEDALRERDIKPGAKPKVKNGIPKPGKTKK